MENVIQIFNDLFNDCEFFKMIDELTKETEETKDGDKECNKECDKKHSYFRKVKDTFNNGNHVSHVEKEIKDGEVLKDINETYQLDENKNDKNTFDEDFYVGQLKKANDLLEEANRTIETLKTSEKMLTNRCDEYERKLNAIMKAIQ